jgi:hypothetical protein
LCEFISDDGVADGAPGKDRKKEKVDQHFDRRSEFRPAG